MAIKIGHKHGGRIVRIIAIAHSTYKKNAEWHFVGHCEWSDGSHARDPQHECDIPPYALCYLDDSAESKADIDKALAALNDYLARNGDWSERGHWVPHVKAGREVFTME